MRRNSHRPDLRNEVDHLVGRDGRQIAAGTSTISRILLHQRLYLGKRRAVLGADVGQQPKDVPGRRLGYLFFDGHGHEAILALLVRCGRAALA